MATKYDEENVDRTSMEEDGRRIEYERNRASHTLRYMCARKQNGSH